jgi:hypothetical protein
LQIVLAGQPELAQRLSRPGLAQLSQRIAVHARLDPLPPAEVVNYVKHRLRVAGCEDPQLFTPGALGIVAELSQGIPRLINAMCFNALSLGLAMKRKQVSSEIVREAGKDFGLGSGSPVPMRKVEPAPAPRLIVHPAPSFWQSLGSRIRDVVKRRLVQASGLCLAFGLMTILFTGDKQRAAVPPTVLGKASPANKMTTGAEPSVSPPPQTNVASAPSPPALQQVDLPEISPRSFGYVIQPHDTIRGLCLSAFKRYDADVLSEIRRLNPGLKDINRLAVGQEIQLPLSIGE